MYSKDVEITAEQGLHTRPATQFIKAAKAFDADIKLTAHGKTVKATSMLKLQTLGLVQGTMVTLSAEGAQAQEAVDSLVELMGQLH